MPDSPEQIEAMFPKLDDAQIARLSEFGERRTTQAGEVLFEQGDSTHGVMVVPECCALKFRASRVKLFQTAARR